MQVLFKSCHPQATALRDLTERRVHFFPRRLGRSSRIWTSSTAEASKATARSAG